MKISEVRELTTEEIRERIAAEKLHLDQQNIDHVVSSLENPALLKEQRRTIARLHTELTRREREAK